jgi:hypothetical protein
MHQRRQVNHFHDDGRRNMPIIDSASGISAQSDEDRTQMFSLALQSIANVFLYFGLKLLDLKL